MVKSLLYVLQLARIYLDLLNIYKCLSENISNAVIAGGVVIITTMNIIKYHPFIGEHVTKQPLVAGMRTVKKETLKLLSCWVSKCQDTAMVSW